MSYKNALPAEKYGIGMNSERFSISDHGDGIKWDPYCFDMLKIKALNSWLDNEGQDIINEWLELPNVIALQETLKPGSFAQELGINWLYLVELGLFPDFCKTEMEENLNGPDIAFLIEYGVIDKLCARVQKKFNCYTMQNQQNCLKNSNHQNVNIEKLQNASWYCVESILGEKAHENMVPQKIEKILMRLSELGFPKKSFCSDALEAGGGIVDLNDQFWELLKKETTMLQLNRNKKILLAFKLFMADEYFLKLKKIGPISRKYEINNFTHELLMLLRINGDLFPWEKQTIAKKIYRNLDSYLNT